MKSVHREDITDRAKAYMYQYFSLEELKSLWKTLLAQQSTGNPSFECSSFTCKTKSGNVDLSQIVLMRRDTLVPA